MIYKLLSLVMLEQTYINVGLYKKNGLLFYSIVH